MYIVSERWVWSFLCGQSESDGSIKIDLATSSFNAISLISTMWSFLLIACISDNTAYPFKSPLDSWSKSMLSRAFESFEWKRSVRRNKSVLLSWCSEITVVDFWHVMFWIVAWWKGEKYVRCQILLLQCGNNTINRKRKENKENEDLKEYVWPSLTMKQQLK